VEHSVCGTSHEKTGQPCQDAHRWKLLPGDVLVGAVADGVGSAALGDVGATIAVQTAIDTLCLRQDTPQCPASDEAWRALLTDALQTARAAIEAEAQARAVKTRDLATTLILVVATLSAGCRSPGGRRRRGRGSWPRLSHGAGNTAKRGIR
jgi:serine/threonine protein phosphatase PrpC